VADGSVEIVNIDDPPALPGTTFGCEYAQVVLIGNPEQESATEFWNVPPSGETLMVIEEELPRATVTDVAEGAIEKSTPVPLRFTE
jgi:hypothetical protein